MKIKQNPQLNFIKTKQNPYNKVNAIMSDLNKWKFGEFLEQPNWVNNIG